MTRHTQHGRHHTRRGARHSTYFSLSPPIKVLSEEEATVQVATEIEAVIQDEQEFRVSPRCIIFISDCSAEADMQDKLNDESKTRHDAYLDAVKDIHAEPFDIQAAYEATIATFLADFQLGQPELAEDCEAAIQTLEDPYFKPQDGDRARFNFDQCSSLATRIMVCLLFLSLGAPKLQWHTDDCRPESRYTSLTPLFELKKHGPRYSSCSTTPLFSL